MRYLDQVDVTNKKVIIRVDFNVPLDGDKVHEEYRIKACLPTLQYLLEHKAAVIACSHLGKPKGTFRPEMSLKPVAKRLGELLKTNVRMAPDCVGEEVASMAAELAPGQIMLLENLRFHEEERKNDESFSRALASLADLYVNDAFGVAHRAHASVEGITHYIKECCAGLLLKKELQCLGDLLSQPKRPYVVISGGSKVSSKLGIFTMLLKKMDRIIVGGAMANTFRMAEGYPVGNSLVEKDLLDTAREIMEEAKKAGVSFYLPVDYITGTAVDAPAPAAVRPFQDVPDDEMILDTGPASHALFSEVLKDAGSVVWNGPMGAFENPAFSHGSFSLAQTVAGLDDALTVVGGGDTDALIHQCGLVDKFDFVSTGGGSFLEFLEGKTLPAIKALKECDR